VYAKEEIYTNPAGYIISPAMVQFIEGRPIPDWKRFLAVAANKQALIKTKLANRLCNTIEPQTILLNN
jgi:hypothetical protein